MAGYRAYLDKYGIEPDFRYDHAPQVDGALGVVLGGAEGSPELREVSGSAAGHDWWVRFDQHVKIGLPDTDKYIGFYGDSFLSEELEVIGFNPTLPVGVPFMAMMEYDTAKGKLIAIRTRLPNETAWNNVALGTDRWRYLENYLRSIGKVQ